IAEELKKAGFAINTKLYFDTIVVACDAKKIHAAAETKGINFRKIDDKHVGISLDQTVEIEDLNDVLSVFGAKAVSSVASSKLISASNLNRKSAYLSHPTFNTFHSESDMMR